SSDITMSSEPGTGAPLEAEKADNSEHEQQQQTSEAAAPESAAVAGAAEALTEAGAAASASATAAAVAAAASASTAPSSGQQPEATVEQAGDALLLQAAGKLSIEELSRNTFQAISDYVKGELEITIDDYALLVEMNRVATQKYADMHNVASGVSKSLEDLNEKYRALQPYLDQVDHLEASVTQLEQAAYRLDAYSKRLEAKFKSLEKR
ncbi:hypothetical protein BOX15_Mlig029542g1, partial [Macrostomum lignano]